MSVEEEDTSLKDLVTKTLQNNGVLGKIQAQLRASVFLALEEEFKDKNVPLMSPSVKKLLGTREGVLAAALVQDFLQSLNLDFSLSVFAPESGHSALWNFPGKDAVKKDLKLDTSKGDGPLLLEILKERELPRHCKNEDPKKLSENQLNYVSPPKSVTQINPSLPQLNELKQLTQLKELSSDTMADGGELKELPLVTSKVLEDDMMNGSNDEEHSSLESQSAENSQRTITNSKSLEDGSEESIQGVEKNYEEDFSSFSEKEVQEEEEIEEDEDIEEDISDLINSSISVGSDHTKDQSLSQTSDIPNYQEEL